MKKLEDFNMTCDFLDMAMYNGLEEVLKDLEEYIKKHPTAYSVTWDDLYGKFDRCFESQRENCFFWGMLVLHFGDYGTSPRYGWIDSDKFNDFLEFMEAVRNDEEMHYVLKEEDWQQ